MMDITAIDFETANASLASVCSVGISTMQDGVADEKYYSLIHPEENVSQFSYWNIRIHGIHPEDVEEAPGFVTVFHEMYPYLSRNLVCAHNAGFDMGCLKASCLNTGLSIPDVHWFDTVELARHAWPELPHHKLDDMCSYLDIQLNHHNAASDAYGCLMIAANAMNMAGIFDIEELLEYYQVHIHSLRDSR